ncbi:hypothetical protein LTR86_010487 [Recurvomyces mirabilis]|nr:hypothetical protein LTR86_010487 [Recurvomyces mirabilis]
MDPLTGVSLAGTIIQFLDFGAKVVSTSVEIGRSKSGATATHEDLHAATIDLKLILDHLKNSIEQKSIHHSLTADDYAELRLAKQCHVVAVELRDLLKRLNNSDKHSKWQSLYHGLLVVCKKEQVAQLECRLGQLRQELVLRVLVSIREQVHVSRVQQAGVAEDLKDVVCSVLSELSASAQWRAEVVRQLEGYRMSSESVPESLQATTKKLSDEMLNEMVAGLGFTGMRDREEHIEPAAAKTFQWIFEQPEFTNWLGQGPSLHWITGKAGSGKSTLMKFISTHPQTTQLLDSTYGRDKYTIGSFYFWDPGSPLQKSYEGLLRSLLADVLRSHPHLMLDLVPEYVAVHCMFGLDARWTTKLCLQALERVSNPMFTTHQFMFFVDGLDEYNGPHDEVISLMKKWAASPNIRVCVSSRPWVVFDDAFADIPQLMLQDLTYPDIQKFVQDRFLSHSGFIRLKEFDPDTAHQLLDEVISKASGVFLWVRLVVESLLTGLRDGDRMSDLRRRLDSIPEDLHEFFWKMLSGVDENAIDYRSHAAELFQLKRSHDQHVLTLWILALADDGDHLLANSETEISQQRRQLMLENMKRRLNSRTRGLLETSSHVYGHRLISGAKVEYLHRTVKEFVETASVWQELCKTQRIEFKVDEILCKAYLKATKYDRDQSGPYRTRAAEHADQAVQCGYRTASWKEEILQQNDRIVQEQAQIQSCKRVLHEDDEEGGGDDRPKQSQRRQIGQYATLSRTPPRRQQESYTAAQIDNTIKSEKCFQIGPHIGVVGVRMFLIMGLSDTIRTAVLQDQTNLGDTNFESLRGRMEEVGRSR